MTGIATVDRNERIRATRVEVARLLALPYREKLTAEEYATRNRLLFQHVATLPLADREAFTASLLGTDSEMDWSVLDEPWAQRAIKLAVAQTVRYWGDEKLSATEEDLTQSARIILAERAAHFRKARAPWFFLARDLAKLVRYEHRDASLDEMTERDERRDGAEDSDEWTNFWRPAAFERRDARK